MSYYSTSSYLRNSNANYSYISPSAKNYDTHRSYSNLRIPPPTGSSSSSTASSSFFYTSSPTATYSSSNYVPPPAASLSYVSRPRSSTCLDTTTRISSPKLGDHFIKLTTVNSGKTPKQTDFNTTIKIEDSGVVAPSSSSSSSLGSRPRSASSDRLDVRILSSSSCDDLNHYMGMADSNSGKQQQRNGYSPPLSSSSSSSLLRAPTTVKKDETMTTSSSLSSSPASSNTRRTPDECENLTKSKNENFNDLSASAVSNIQLNMTDDLTTQVDYYLNEVDNRMICSGRQIEIESFELSAKTGLISKCIYLNQLLADACMGESHLDCDPIFNQNGKTILIFSSKKDAEDFATKQMHRFSVTFSDNNAAAAANDSNRSRSNASSSSSMKKNVSFNDRNNYTLNVSAGTIDDSMAENNNNNNNSYDVDDSNRFSSSSAITRPILKSSLESTSNINRFPSASSTPRTTAVDSYTGRASIGYGSGSGSLNSDQHQQQDNTNLLITANSNNAKKGKCDGYEILTIRAKLKQRVNQNRTKNVTLGDIDSIMRNVVTIIQDEFMKRFPSGPSTSALNNDENKYVSRN